MKTNYIYLQSLYALTRGDKSHLINSYSGKYLVKLSNGDELPVSRRKRNQYKEWFDAQNIS